MTPGAMMIPSQDARSKPGLSSVKTTGERKPVRLGDFLIEKGLITQDQLVRALELQKRTGDRLGSALVREGYITEEILRACLSGLLNVDVASEEDLDIDPELATILPDEFVKRFEVVPVRLENDVLLIATATPRNLALADEVRFITGVRRVQAVLATEASIRRVIEEHYSTRTLLQDIIQRGGVIEKALALHKEEDQDKVTDIYQLQLDSEAQPIVALVNFLLVESVRRKASDIHVEPYDDFFRIRMRIDGILHLVLSPPLSLHRPLISRVKIMAGMDISKTRIPQDGHIGLEYMEEVLHYRVNTLPTVAGEKCVIRLLKKEHNLTDLRRLGISKEILEPLERTIHLPQGLVLVTGPTGSGKTTTVHAALGSINTIETNIVTLENPVEASIPGINHVQIQKQGGVSFIEGLKAILRQDPDVIFLGEIRDREVAKIAMEAAMTGHMVFSTLHTNSAVETLMRLDDMEVEMFLIAGALRCIMAQRLIRRNCPQCKVEVKPDVARLEELGVSIDRIMKGRFYKGMGCNHCMNSGFKGRLAAYEVMFVDDTLRSLIRNRADLADIEACAKAKGMVTLLEAGLELVLDGLTTLNEVIRCIGE